MRRVLLLVGIAGVVLITIGCSGKYLGTGPYTEPPEPSTEWVSGWILFRQQVRYEGTGASHSRTLSTVLEVQPDTVTLLVLSPMGSPAYRIVQGKGGRRVHQISALPLPVAPRRLLADHQFILWPRLDLPDPYRVERVDDTRHVYRGDRRLLAVHNPGIDSTGEKRRLEHLRANYRVIMEGVHVRFGPDTPGVDSP